MRCAEVQQAVPLYVVGELEANLAGGVKTHLRECRPCSELARDMEGIDALCRATLGTLRPGRRPRVELRSGALGAAVILLALGVAAYVGYRSHAPTDDPAGSGRVLAVVTFKGRPTRVAVTGANACCPAHVGKEFVSGGGLEEVLVYLKSETPANAHPIPAERVVLKKQGCAFTPRAAAIRVGQRILLRNYDEGALTLDLSCRKNKECAFRLSGRGAGEEFRDEEEGFFPLAEIGMTIECELHPWIRATVHVLDHPYFAFVSPDGSATLKGLPPGEHTIAAWHPRYGESVARVRVGDRRSGTVRFDFETP